MRSRTPRFLPAEIEQIRRAMEPQEAAHAAERMRAGGARNFRMGDAGRKGRAKDRVGELVGVSGRTVEKIAEIYAAAAADPERIGPLVEAMNRSGMVDGAYKKMKRAQDEARVLGLAPIDGRFMTLAFDPPWEDDSVSEAQRPAYATMSVAEIRAVPVESWQRDEGHIYVHCPGPFIRVAIELVGVWGYDFKTVLVWKKSHFSMGRYFRTLDEFVVFGVRGGLMTRRQDIPNHFDGPVGEHSEKPEDFYELVRRASYPPYGEGFQRLARPDFVNLYQPRDAAAHAVAAE